MGFMSELDDLSFDQLIDLFEVSRHPEGVVYYREVALRIRRQGYVGVGFLLGRMSTTRANQLRSVFLGLTFPPLESFVLRDLLRKRLLVYLHDKRPLIVADAIDALLTQGERNVVDEVLRLRHDPSPFVRGAVLRYISHVDFKNAPSLLVAALQDPSYLVRENAIDELDDLDVTDAVEHIRRLLEDPHPHVRQAAQTAIDNLTGKEEG
jgi:hypothetical protein